MSTAIRETYAQWLSRKLDEAGYTVRAFAKKMNPEAPEIARRTLRRYLSGQYVPREAARGEIATHLASEETGPDDDDSEDDLLSDLERRIAEITDLLRAARDRVAVVTGVLDESPDAWRWGADGPGLSSSVSVPRRSPSVPADALAFTCSNCCLTFAEPFCEMCGRNLNVNRAPPPTVSAAAQRPEGESW